MNLTKLSTFGRKNKKKKMKMLKIKSRRGDENDEIIIPEAVSGTVDWNQC